MVRASLGLARRILTTVASGGTEMVLCSRDISGASRTDASTELTQDEIHSAQNPSARHHVALIVAARRIFLNGA